VAEAAKQLGLNYVVITSVTRDDLHDGGAGQFAKTIKEMRDIYLIRQHTSRGQGVPVSEIYTLYRFDDIPEEEKNRRRVMVEEKKGELGNLPEEVKNLYLILVGGLIHDIYVLRAMFGSPRKIVFTKRWGIDRSIPNCLLSILEYSEDLSCIYSWGPWNRKVNDIDIGFIVYGKEKVINFNFPFDSYLKNDPSSVIIKEMEGDVFVEKRIIISFDECFRRELIHFHDCIVGDKEPLCNGRQAKEDLKLILDIAKGITV